MNYANLKTRSNSWFFTAYVLTIALLVSFNAKANNITQASDSVKTDKIRVNIESAKVNSSTTEIVKDERLSTKKGASLKAAIKAAINNERSEPDLVFNIQVPTAGRYTMRTYATTNAEGAALMKKAKGKLESLFIKIQIDDNRPTKRVVYVPWDVPLQTSGKFDFTGKPQQIKIWLPRGVQFDYIDLSTYTPPAVPLKAQNFVPQIVPPASHPRLWVNQESLPLIKSRINTAENSAAWANVKKAAQEPFVFKFDPNVETKYNEALESAAEKKAFYYLITGDKTIGKEALTLMDEYLYTVEFGNVLDVTREIGRAIYIGSEVYDWCYDLMDAKQKDRMQNSLLRLADDMEIGWPPFLEPIVYGHGNEAQVCRDLLSMSIAIYDENPLPYKYTSYAVLEQLVPMRKFQYQSGRHNQGVSYGAYRFGWDLHAAWLFYRMTGKEVFDSNIKDVSSQFLYMRTPDGQMLRDGDGFGTSVNGKPYYWSNPQTTLLAYAYGADPVLKADFIRQGGLNANPVLYLLLNNPSLKPATTNTLPLTKDFGPVLGGMVARTGWDISDESDDVVAEIKGGGYQFANHQHSDAGSIQLFYRGFQFGDIGLYKFYGTPYDMNFNKRSISHSMMLAVDPNEKFGNLESNDGGTKSVRINPETEEQVVTDPFFHNGKVLSTDFGPSKTKPYFSYFSVDLTSAYSSKITSYNRNFCFLNTGIKEVPAIIIVADDMTTADPNFKKYWQINSINRPEIDNDKLIFHATYKGRTGKTFMNMLTPSASERETTTLSGEEAISSFGIKYTVPITNYPESHASRTMISPLKAKANDRFVTVFQVTNEQNTPLPVEHFKTTVSDVIVVADRLVSLANKPSLIKESFVIEVPKNKKTYQVLLTGINAGTWNVVDKHSNLKFNVEVKNGENTIFFIAKNGEFTLSPGLLKDAKMLVRNEKLTP